MYITLRNLISISKIKIIQIYISMKNILRCLTLFFFIKNIEFYIVLGYFLFYISFYLHQVDLKLILVVLKLISRSYIDLHHYSFIFLLFLPI